jgi:NAD(P)-dependent dehydrogenase (short-subunit alcohol dehydrogenase family)
MLELKSDVALVTGAGSGLGAAIARRLAAAGATVIVADVAADRGQAVAERIAAAGGAAEAVALDVAQPEAVDRVLRDALGRHGRLDIVVNNAGIDATAPFGTLPVADWERILRVNLHGAYLVAHHAFPVMCRQGRGHIVNIVSTAAKRAWANAAAYHASKWGLLGLSHALHVEGRTQGVKVTAVIAGGMRTPFLLDRFEDLDPATLQPPENVAEAVRFVLTQPAETVIPEITVLPMQERSWP